MTAVAAELQAQVDDLNDERVRLLKKLRDGAASGAATAAVAPGGVAGGGEQYQRSVSAGGSEGGRASGLCSLWGGSFGGEVLFVGRFSLWGGCFLWGGSFCAEVLFVRRTTGCE